METRGYGMVCRDIWDVIITKKHTLCWCHPIQMDHFPLQLISTKLFKISKMKIIVSWRRWGQLLGGWGEVASVDKTHFKLQINLKLWEECQGRLHNTGLLHWNSFKHQIRISISCRAIQLNLFFPFTSVL